MAAPIISPTSSWTPQQVAEFLSETSIPMRLSCIDDDGYPIICSLWFYHQDGLLWSATHKNSYIIKVLRNNPNVAFEIATNDYPYRGVRGKGTVELVQDKASSVLGRLIKRYLGDSNSALSRWLMGRADDEYVLRVTPVRMNSWDFSSRMTA
jgi:general stress protein 26